MSDDCCKPTEAVNNEISNVPSFIRLAEPPAFDINRCLFNIRNQLTSDQLSNLEQALKLDPDLLSQASKTDLILDCDAEESFTLETFGNLLKAARGAHKDFIIARVTTLDPTGIKPQLYHSHYSAHQINKILFRTQPEEALLHRMKSRNPLNNMLIVGEVNYFAIRPNDFDVARERYARLVEAAATSAIPAQENPNLMSVPTSTPTDNSLTCSLTDSLLYGLLQRKKLETELAGKGETEIADPLEIDPTQQINVAHFENAAEFTSPHMDQESAVLRLSRNGSSASLTRSDSLNKLPTDGEPAILYEAHPFATDDDFLVRSEVREYFKSNSINHDDYLLFTLYRGSEGVTEIPVTGFTSIPMPEGGVTTARRVRSWKNCWGLFYPPSPSLSTLRTGVISREAFKFILALYIIGCVLSLVFFIPLELSYFIGFGMLALIVFVTVFLVECNPDPNSTRWNLFTHRQRMQQQRERANANANITSSHTVYNNAAATSVTALNSQI